MLNKIPIYMFAIFFIHPSIEGHLGCFYNLANVNKAKRDRGIQMYLYEMFFFSFWTYIYIMQKWDTQSGGRSIF